jgi:hypothetical protein
MLPAIARRVGWLLRALLVVGAGVGLTVLVQANSDLPVVPAPPLLKDELPTRTPHPAVSKLIAPDGDVYIVPPVQPNGETRAK